MQNLLNKIYFAPTEKKKIENFFWLIKTRMEIAPEPLLRTKKK